MTHSFWLCEQYSAFVANKQKFISLSPMTSKSYSSKCTVAQYRVTFYRSSLSSSRKRRELHRNRWMPQMRAWCIVINGLQLSTATRASQEWREHNPKTMQPLDDEWVITAGAHPDKSYANRIFIACILGYVFARLYSHRAIAGARVCLPVCGYPVPLVTRWR